MLNRLKTKTWYLPLILALLALACSMPGARREPTAPTPAGLGEAEVFNAEQATAITMQGQALDATLPPEPTATPQLLPPALVEADPPLDSTIPLQGAFTLYFNQAMDRPSVELALGGEPALSGAFTWVDAATVVFEPDAPYLPGSQVRLTLGTSALAQNGLFLPAPIELSYRTAPPLKTTQLLPEPGLEEVDPGSAVVATFNQPVVPLGADPETLPEAFSISPPVAGRGEWVNTSTYIFYPEPAMAGGTGYIVRLNPGLTSTGGAALVGRDDFAETPFEWGFQTSSPRLVSFDPRDGAEDVRLDAAFRVRFSQPMEAEGVEAHFSLQSPTQEPLRGEFRWSEDFTTLTFTPTELLERSAHYNLVVQGSSEARGGTPLGIDYVAGVNTVEPLAISSTEPGNSGSKPHNASVVLYFNGPAESLSPLEHISFTPEVANLTHWWGEGGRSLYLQGDFTPISAYTATISGDLPDPWDGILGEAYTFTFKTSPLDPSLFSPHTSMALSLTPEDQGISVQASNLERIGLRLGTVPLDDLVRFLAPGGYQVLRSYRPEDMQQWSYEAGIPGDRSYTAQLPVTPQRGGLGPGIYHLGFWVPDLAYQPQPYLLVSSSVQVTFKMSTMGAFVWVVDTRTNLPAEGVPVSVYDSSGIRLARGYTDAQGVFQSPIDTQPDLYETYFALAAYPGDEFFGLSFSNWSQGIEGYDFGLQMDYSAPHLVAYLYTDRPIYRPGQEVYFRVVARHEYNGRYALPEEEVIPVTVYDAEQSPAASFELRLSEFGTAHEAYRIPEGSRPGYYQLSTPYGSVRFQVAEYRVPEIEMTFGDLAPLVAGDTVEAQLSASYFFGAPAGNVPLSWNVYRERDDLHLPGYRVGVDEYAWMNPPWMRYPSPFGEKVASGGGETDPEGIKAIGFETEAGLEGPYKYTLEATLVDESGFPTSARAEVTAHPAEFYIGVRADTWVGQAGREIGFEVLVVDWGKRPAGERELLAKFQRVDWVREDSPEPYGYPVFIPAYTPVSSADLRTAPDGLARLAFTPPEAGTYQLEVSGGGARTQVLVWVGGTGQVFWPDLPNNRLRLTADKEAYLPGEMASIFIPNPFGEGALALVTVERDEVLRYEVLEPQANGSSYALALSDQDAPNIYVSVTLIGKDASSKLDFRYGCLNLPVAPVRQELKVEVQVLDDSGARNLGSGDDFEPREEATVKIRVTDSEGKPVEGEFSLSLVDKAVLALADPNAADILPAFYGVQPLGVRTGMSLVVYAHRLTNFPGGQGGGGGEDQVGFIRSDFPDTAYWNAEVVTDANGEAEISLTLPDNLTTWELDLRGLTADTRVGQSRVEIVTTKELLVRPVVPRFLVAGDHVRLAAVVHNNTDVEVVAEVSLQAAGFTLDDPASVPRSISIPAGGRLERAWWGMVEDVDRLEVVFTATGGGYKDAVSPEDGGIPVLRFAPPQTFSTAGMLELESERLEIISLQRTFEPAGGTLQVELAPSLAATMLSGLEALEHYPYECTEQTLSRFLPNLMAYRAIQDLGLDSPDLERRLENTLEEGLQKLTAQQNQDGGWGWWPGDHGINSPGYQGASKSDGYISAYVLFGLHQAAKAGANVDEAVLSKAVDYILAAMPELEMLSSTWQLDRLAFYHFVLSQVGSGNAEAARDFFDVRDQLSPYAKAFLALALEGYDPGDARIDTLLSDLEATAIRSAAGVHWEGKGVKANLDTPLFNTAVVAKALAHFDPASGAIPGAVRYLVSHRGPDGTSGSTYETAWGLIALTEVMKGTGELAGDYGFSATLNGEPLLEGAAGGNTRLNPVSSTVPISELNPGEPNGLRIYRTAGPGRLYYLAHLDLLRPLEEVTPVNQGIVVSRSYHPVEEQAVPSGYLVGGQIQVRVSLVLENDAYYLAVEDYLPAGAEILDTSLKTSQLGSGGCGAAAGGCYAVSTPFSDGWGWWLFKGPFVYDDHIAWVADRLPAGTYELTYTLVLTHPGEYQVLPARAWEFYFPEVQGNSAGNLFMIGE